MRTEAEIKEDMVKLVQSLTEPFFSEDFLCKSLELNRQLKEVHKPKVLLPPDPNKSMDYFLKTYDGCIFPAHWNAIDKTWSNCSFIHISAGKAHFNGWTIHSECKPNVEPRKPTDNAIIDIISSKFGCDSACAITGYTTTFAVAKAVRDWEPGDS